MEHESAAAFVERTRHALVGALFLYCGDRASAEDLAQEALARAWERWDSIEDPDRWVHRVAFNLARSRWRRRQREHRANSQVASRPSIATHQPGDEPSAATVRDAVTALPDRQRQAVVLRFFLDLPVAEIATVMDCAEGTVKATLHQATQALAKRLPDLAEVSDG